MKARFSRTLHNGADV